MKKDPRLLVIDASADAAEHCEKCYPVWFPRLCAYLARFNLGEDAADLAQETLIWACQEPAERCTPAALFRYAYCRAIDLIRKRRREVPLDAPVDDDGRPNDYADPASQNRGGPLDDLPRCMEQLSAEEKTIIYLGLEGFTLAEIGTIVGINSGSVGRKRSEAMNKLTQCMTGRERAPRAYEHREAAGGNEQ